MSNIPLTVELHWNIVKENTANFQIEEMWNDSSTIEGYQHVRELSDLHTFYMICLHGWRHNLDSLKYFIDIIQLIIHLGDKIDYDELEKMTARHQTKKEFFVHYPLSMRSIHNSIRFCLFHIKFQRLKIEKPL